MFFPFGNIAVPYPWGAPFYNFALGEPSFGRFNFTHGAATVPMSFQNHAAFDLVGNIRTELYDSGNFLIGESQTLVSVPPYSSYDGDAEFHVPLNTASLSAVQNGHVNVYFSTSFFEAKRILRESFLKAISRPDFIASEL